MQTEATSMGTVTYPSGEMGSYTEYRQPQGCLRPGGAPTDGDGASKSEKMAAWCPDRQNKFRRVWFADPQSGLSNPDETKEN